MDLQYLLLLQGLRNAAGSFLTPVMLLISDLATTTLVVIGIAVFWSVDREAGYSILLNYVGGAMINSVIKLTACVYRPWIRDPRITPPQAALKSATGYSFPSGHTQVATSFYGSVALWQRRNHRRISILCIIMILLTGFSRNYLGVHTPQDVLVSIAIGTVLLFANNKLLHYLQKNPRALGPLVIIGIALTAAAVLYFTLKTYPVNYADGNLVVDPTEMMIDGYKAAGAMGGCLLGAYIEVRFVNFSTEGSLRGRLLRTAAGLIPLLLIKSVLGSALERIAGPQIGGLQTYFLLCFYATAVWPAVFTAVKRRLL